MSLNLEPLDEAAHVVKYVDQLDRQARLDAATSLAEWGVFSGRQISAITKLDPRVVGRLVSKGDKRGGRLNPQTLPLIVDLKTSAQRGEGVNGALVHAIVREGTSVDMIAKLAKLPSTTLRRRYDAAERARKERC